MFKRKDVLRSLFLFIIIVALMLTLSQILVVHRRTHVSKLRDSRRVQAMISTLMRIEKAIESMMKKTYLSAEDFEEHLKAVMYTERIRSMLMSSPGYIHSITHKNILTANSVFEYLRYQDRRLNFLNVSSDNILKSEHSQSYRSNVKDQTFNELSYSKKSTIAADEETLKVFINKLENDPIHIPKADDTTITLRLEKSKDEYINEHHNSANNSVIDKDRKNYMHRRINDTGYYTNVTDQNIKTVKKCQINLENLEGKLDVQRSIQALPENISDIEPGGSWRPVTCVAQQRIVIIIPYRDRKLHLQALLLNLIPVLKKQLLDFRIFVIEQYGQMTFNKGRLMNAGFKEAWKMGHFDCVIFHDVDLLPENDKNMYTCGVTPRHMSIAVDKFGYRLPYFSLVGGVFSIKREQFLKVNGYSNLYWGWGAEDDDMAFRLRALKMSIERPPANIGRYKMIKHENRETSPVKVRAYLLKTVRKRFHRDGLNTLEYHVVFINNTELFTHIMVDVGSVPDEAADITHLLN